MKKPNYDEPGRQGGWWVVKVDQQTIDEGIERNSHACVVAESIYKSIPNAARVSVDISTIRWTDKESGKRYIFLTPRKAQAVIFATDEGMKDLIKPFRLIIRPFQIVAPSKRKRQPRASLVKEPQQDSLVNARRPTPPKSSLPSSQRTFGLRAFAAASGRDGIAEALLEHERDERGRYRS